MKIKTLLRTNVLLMAVLLLGAAPLSAQILVDAPEPADNPNLAGNSPWTAICAGVGGFNQYFAKISWAGNANSGNEFILELSDASGSFTNAVELGRADDQNGNSPKEFDMEFGIPNDTRGQGYKMRVRSTNPESTSAESAAYNMYYLDVTSNITISDDGSGIPPGTVCATGPITLSVDNVTNPETYQYIWYMSGSPIAGETGPTLNVSTSGMYFALIDYGPTCSGSANTDSNIVDVNIGTGGEGIAINPPSRTVLCVGDTETLSINNTDPTWSYRWFKDSVAIPSATASSYIVDANTADFEGDYQVEISAPSICNERSAVITMRNADSFTITRDNADNMVLLPSQAAALAVTTTAVTPTYKWFRNGAELSGETNNTLSATQEGTYFAEITQGGGTCPGTIKNSEETIVVTPTTFELTVDYASSYTACISTDIVIQLQSIHAVMSDLSKIDVTTDMASSFSYQWKKGATDVGGATNNSISLTDVSENGDYTIEGTVASHNIESNTLSVQLLTSETIAISSNSTIYCSASDIITISASIDLSGETYEWQRDGTMVSTSDLEFSVNQIGTYRLVLDRNGCSLTSNEINIRPLDESLIVLDPGIEVVIPEGTTRSVTASGGTAYRWYDANNVELGISNSMDFSTEGTYMLIANIDDCEIARELTVTYLDTFRVPNVITVNGDGINDQWVIPNSYSNKTDVNVIIYNEKGEEVLNEFEYKNTWPQSSMSFPKQNMVFYYKIRNGQEVLKQGTITVIR